MKKLHTQGFIAILFVVLFTRCERSELTDFSASPAILFEYGNTHDKQADIKSIDYSFIVNQTGSHVLEIPVVINGFPADYDRPFEVEAVQDSLTDAPLGSYEFLPSSIRAGRMTDTLYLMLHNSEALETRVASIHLRVKENEHFVKGIVEKQYFTVRWSNQIIMPTWGVYFRTFFSAVGSTQAFRIFVLTTGLTNFVAADFRPYGQAGAEVLGARFGDYIRKWNAEHPDDILVHDDGTAAGQPIEPRYYTR